MRYFDKAYHALRLAQCTTNFKRHLEACALIVSKEKERVLTGPMMSTCVHKSPSHAAASFATVLEASSALIGATKQTNMILLRFFPIDSSYLLSNNDTSVRILRGGLYQRHRYTWFPVLCSLWTSLTYLIQRSREKG